MNQTLIERINQLRKERRAIILAHNYQRPEIQDIADFCGDSLELARKAAQIDEADVIVFCGVHFMAETAAVLSPDKVVLLPDVEAGCPMADMITAEQLREFKAQHPNGKAVCYVNSSVEVKAECDSCCTSGNALKVIQSYPEDQEILFVPDQYLGTYIEKKLGRKMVLWQGFCPTHQRITSEEILAMKAKYPNAKVVSHPECNQMIQELSDYVESTGGMLKVAQEADEFIVITEEGMIHRLQQEFPEKKFYHISPRCICPNMKKNTLEKVLWALENMAPQVKVEPEIAEKAKRAIDRMLSI